MEYGTIDGNTAGTITLLGNDRGMTSASLVYGSTWAADDRLPKSRHQQ